MKILTTIFIMMMMMSMMFLLTTILSKKSKMSREKNTPFECGFSSMNSARKPFSTHFFLIAMMFLIFDIEISIILPISFTKLTEPKQWLFSSMTTMMILLVGLFHEWYNGMLEWSK